MRIDEKDVAILKRMYAANGQPLSSYEISKLISPKTDYSAAHRTYIFTRSRLRKWMEKKIIYEKDGMFFVNHDKIKVGAGKFNGKTSEGDSITFELPEIIVLDIDNEYFFVCPK